MTIEGTSLGSVGGGSSSEQGLGGGFSRFGRLVYHFHPGPVFLPVFRPPSKRPTPPGSWSPTSRLPNQKCLSVRTQSEVSELRPLPVVQGDRRRGHGVRGRQVQRTEVRGWDVVGSLCAQVVGDTHRLPQGPTTSGDEMGPSDSTQGGTGGRRVTH